MKAAPKKTYEKCKNITYRSEKLQVLLTLFCLMFINIQGVENFNEEENITLTTTFYRDEGSFSTAQTQSPVVIKKDDNVTVVHAVYVETRNSIHFNISWEVPEDVSPISYDFIIKLDIEEMHDPMHPFCSPFNLETYNKDKSIRNIVLPPIDYNYKDEIKPGCPYEIIIIGRQPNQQYIASKKYKVPDCVGPFCDCKIYAPKINLLNITQISLDVYNVTFSEDYSAYHEKYNITYIVFEYFRMNESNYHFTLHDNVIEKAENHALINFTELVRPKKSDMIRATFQNNFSCESTSNITFTYAEFQKKNSHVNWVEIIVPLTILIIILFALLIHYRKEIKYTKIKNICLFSNTNSISTSLYKIPTNVCLHNQQEIYNILYVDPLEFNRCDITFIKEIGNGYFGKVYQAEYSKIKGNPPASTVAIKILRENAPCEETDDFLFEIDIFKKIKDHPNVVKLLGCCTKTEPYLMVMEYCEGGDLYNYLLNLRKQWHNRHTSSNYFFSHSSTGEYIVPDNTSTPTSSRLPSVTDTEYTMLGSECQTPLLDKPNPQLEVVLDNSELQNFAYQIANGMAYLEKIPITHRDLAARNILMNTKKELKISDFGLSRSGPYINNRLKKQPLRWMAIESIEDHFFNNKSDVWSFAVVLWEMGTLGAFPYENTPNDLVLHDLLIGRRLQRPEICTDELYSLMLRCWSRDPDLRPTFAELVDLLSPKQKRIYVDFSQLNPSYIFPPLKLEK